mgnify:CR=1 FL=1
MKQQNKETKQIILLFLMSLFITIITIINGPIIFLPIPIIPLLYCIYKMIELLIKRFENLK